MLIENGQPREASMVKLVQIVKLEMEEFFGAIMLLSPIVKIEQSIVLHHLFLKNVLM